MAKPLTPIPPRRKPGRKPAIATLTPDLIFAVRYSYLTDPHATIVAVAASYNLSSHVVAQLLTGPEYESIRDQIHKASTQVVRDRLHAASDLAASRWIEAMGPAAAKGDHRPARDLLAANKVVDITNQAAGAPAVVIQIGVNADQVTLTPVVQAPQDVTLAVTPAPYPPDVPSADPPSDSSPLPALLPPGTEKP